MNDHVRRHGEGRLGVGCDGRPQVPTQARQSPQVLAGSVGRRVDGGHYLHVGAVDQDAHHLSADSADAVLDDTVG